MKIFLAIFLLFGFSCDGIQLTNWIYHHRWARSSEAKVAGGSEARRHEYRFLILLEGTRASSTLCHGVLVAPHIVLGAAQSDCSVNPANRLVAKAGMHTLSQRENTVQTREVCHVDVHSSSLANGSFSYAIYHLSDPFYVNNYVGTISLPLSTVRMRAPCRAASCICTAQCHFASWSGTQTSLTHILLTIRVCNNDGSYFCADPGPCNDLGAPLVCTAGNRQFTPGTHASSGCGSNRAIFASYFNDVFRSWYSSRVKQVPTACRPRH